MQLQLSDLRELLRGESDKSHSMKVGEKYLIRGITLYYTGRVSSITDTDIVLEDAAWVADSGRFHDALKGGHFKEVEPFVDPVVIPRGTICDATVWRHELPRSQK